MSVGLRGEEEGASDVAIFSPSLTRSWACVARKESCI